MSQKNLMMDQVPIEKTSSDYFITFYEAFKVFIWSRLSGVNPDDATAISQTILIAHLPNICQRCIYWLTRFLLKTSILLVFINFVWNFKVFISRPSEWRTSGQCYHNISTRIYRSFIKFPSEIAKTNDKLNIHRKKNGYASMLPCWDILLW